MDNPMCGCIAHQDVEHHYFTHLLMEIAPPLTDDSGGRLATTLLPSFVKESGMTTVSVEAVRAGTQSSVAYILQVPSGETSMFSGWPDYQLLQYFSPVETRLGRYVLRQDRVRGIGEVQSPPGNSSVTKTAVLAQAGVYTVGQFRRCLKRKIATIILYKDVSAHVAIATLDPTKATAKESYGEIISYKLVDSVHGYALHDPDKLSRFVSVFITTLKATLVPVPE